MEFCKRIVFIGGGHSNLVAIRKLILKHSHEDVKKLTHKLILISEHDYSAYSGMVPGNICDIYKKEEAFIDLIKFSQLYNIQFIKSKVTSIQPTQKKIILENNMQVDFDICR
jgi:NADH dehydrogenase FAD-containing subunit